MKKGYGVRIDPDGTIEVVKLDGTLESLQKQVGGNIEAVRMPYRDMRLMLVDDAGKLLGMPVNELATALCLYRDIIVGSVLVLAGISGDNFAYYTEKGAKKIADELNPNFQPFI